MNQIEKQVDGIIVRLKMIDELKPLRFVREYGTHDIEMPVTGLLAVVSLTDTALTKSHIGDYLSSTVKGERYRAKAEIRVYAPATENGSGLSETVSVLMAGLKSADTEKIITDIGASSIEFDPDMNSICRTVNFAIEFYLCEEA
ncbi:MAG: hypothetical protein LUF33_06030 [Clostridiales bacterium]|nr:hypothetical protein [Clostridiales bacterium]